MGLISDSEIESLAVIVYLKSDSYICQSYEGVKSFLQKRKCICYLENSNDYDSLVRGLCVVQFVL